MPGLCVTKNASPATAATNPIVKEPKNHEFAAHLRAEIDLRMAVTPAMLHSINAAGLLVSVSDAWLDKLGYSREEVIGRPSADFLTPESRARAIREVLPEFFKVGRCENIHYQMVKKCGGVIDVLVSAVLADDPSGHGRISLAVITDITALLETKRLLRESEARYRNLVEEQTDLVALITPDGELRYANRAYASFCGQRPEEMIGRSLYEFVPQQEHEALTRHLQRVLATGESIEAENQIILSNGERRWLAWSNRVLIDEHGRATAIHSVGRDIQQRVEGERRIQASEAQYRFLAENSTDLILLVAEDGKRLYASPASRKLLGYEPHETIAMRLHEAIHPDDGPRVLQILADRPGDTLLTYRMRRKDGSYIWVETTGKTVELADGERQRLIIVRDIEQRIAAEERLKASEARYRLLADNSTDVVMALDRNLMRTYVSPSSFEMFGYTPQELVGSKTGNSAHPEDTKRLRENLQSLLEGRIARYVGVNRRRHRDGRWIWVETCYRAIRESAGGEITGIIASVRDVTARKAIEIQLAEANRRLRALAARDPLTGLANRRMLDETLAREYRRAKRGFHPIALIMLDVDRFKAFNDLYGHPAGDECLKRIAEALTRSMRRSGDVAARYGGEEFAIVLPATDEAGGLLIASRVRQTVLDLAIEHDGNEIGIVTISAGVAAAHPNSLAEVRDGLVREADRALYLAKKNGRNTIALASTTPSTRASTTSAAA